MAPLTLGAVAVALTGHLSYALVVLVVEVNRFGAILCMGAMNASYIVQLVTIVNQNWINNFEDKKVIMSSIVCSLLHYGVYLPDLIMVSFRTFNQ